MDLKTSFQLELSFKPDTTTSIIASQVEDQKNPAYSPTTLDNLLLQDLNPTHQMFNSVPFTPSTGGPCFANPAQAFCAPYPSHLQAQYLDFFNHSIIPALGPILSLEVNWIPHLTHNQSSFEPSWNIYGQDQITPEQQIRFTFEPIGPLAGTEEDPLNQLVPHFFVSALASSNTRPNLDLIWWHHFIGELFVTSAETARINELLPLGHCPPTC
ncbi:hypothetical protein BDZ45DRAFT_740273 [Acephala macrosclerotiorum]|nr:hypothetical protein BDZ45DRAFT_740273 [Acephala macrosclerotiorum]